MRKRGKSFIMFDFLPLDRGGGKRGKEGRSLPSFYFSLHHRKKGKKGENLLFLLSCSSIRLGWERRKKEEGKGTSITLLRPPRGTAGPGRGRGERGVLLIRGIGVRRTQKVGKGKREENRPLPSFPFRSDRGENWSSLPR